MLVVRQVPAREGDEGCSGHQGADASRLTEGRLGGLASPEQQERDLERRQREDRLANTYLEIRQQVDRWQGNTRLRWSPQDIESVAEFLASRYYKVPH